MGPKKVDPWAGESYEYDPEAFYTAASDDKGHSATVSGLTVTPQTKAMMGYLAASNNWPYKTSNDVARDGINHIITKRLSEVGDPETNKRLRYFHNHMLRLERMEEDQRYMLELQTIQGALKLKLGMKDSKGLLYEISQVEEIKDDFPPTLRDDLLKLLNHYRDSLAKLMQVVDDEDTLRSVPR